MNIPEEFTERLQETFGGKYRIRWSPSRNEFQIEQKVRRGLVEGSVNVSPRNVKQRRLNEDNLIRARDGYVLTLSVTPGTTTECPECNSTLKVPAFRSESVFCQFCRSRGRQRHKVVGYWPLSDSLIDHLRKLDWVHRGGSLEQVNDAVERHNELLMFNNRMSLRRAVDASVRQDYNRIVGIPQFGYAGSPYRWDKE